MKNAESCDLADSLGKLVGDIPPALERGGWRQKDQEIKARLSYIVILGLASATWEPCHQSLPKHK